MNALVSSPPSKDINADSYAEFVVFLESGTVSYFHGPRSQFPDYFEGLTSRMPGENFVVIRAA